MSLPKGIGILVETLAVDGPHPLLSLARRPAGQQVSEFGWTDHPVDGPQQR